MEKTQVVFIPPPLLGHIFPFVQLANLLTTLNQHLCVTLLLMKLPFDEKVAKYTNSLPSTSTCFVKFVELDLPKESYSHLLSRKTFFFYYIDAHKNKVRDYLVELKKAAVIVVDIFTTSMIHVGNELGFSSYVCYTSGAAQLGLALHVQSLADDYNIDVTGYYNLDTELHVPTLMNPISSKLLPSVVYDKEGESRVYLDLIKKMREAKGIIVNTFLELESHAVRALSEDKNIPKVYTGGPLLNTLNREEEEEGTIRHDIIQWLDLQPDSSVLFLCFGSKGWFGVEQIKEIALALERSGHRFVWSLRRPVAVVIDSLNDILPEGFIQRTRDVGKVIGWAPQLAVLSHPAVGGFVSHCGWNSTLESIWCGVPMAAWPIYAEQNGNAFQIVKEIGIGVEIKMDYRNDNQLKSREIVSAQVIEDALKRLIKS